MTALFALTGCYSPAVRDCTVTCSTGGDCAADQVCGGDHYCASPRYAGTCAPLSVIGDAAIDGAPDATLADAPAPDAARPDAAVPVTLHIHIDGKGEVAIAGGPTCDHPDCMFDVMVGVPLTLDAMPQPHQRFDRWTTLTCAGQPATCTFVPILPTTVGARFEKDGG